ncbi:MAG TPA: LysR family transcriptional regulator [Planctomycetota bacterium]|nr:LysR family transcriptional regulator [Planctomycetota bacterium]
MTSIKLLDKELPVKLDWLRSFLAVAELESFTKAAKQLQISQPAVSTHIRELEENLHVRLFEKIGSRTRLSLSGEVVVGEARAIVQGVRHLRDMALESETGIGGILSVGASTTPGNYVLPRLLGEFERLYPAVRTHLVIGNSARILDRLRANEVDLGAVGINPASDEFVTRPLCDDELVVFAPLRHPLSRRRVQIPAADLLRERFILREADSATRRLTESWFASQKAAPTIMELGCPETVKRAVGAGLGLGILTKFAIAPEAGERDFAVLRVPGFPIRRSLYMAHLRQKRLTRTMTAFLDLLKTSKHLPRTSR